MQRIAQVFGLLICAAYLACGSEPTEPASPPEVTLDTDQHFLNRGETSVLVWNAANAESCSAGWTASKATSGRQAVTPASTTTYTITCTGRSGSASASTTVNVVN